MGIALGVTNYGSSNDTTFAHDLYDGVILKRFLLVPKQEPEERQSGGRGTSAPHPPGVQWGDSKGHPVPSSMVGPTAWKQAVYGMPLS
ncbi:hypothetical protein SRHO_G00287360 [Serrasalmus rhombeus]